MALSAFAAGNGKDQFFNGAFRADDVRLNWLGSGAKEGALVQSAQWQCQRTVNFLYEIGSTAVYYVGNRRQGNANFTRVVAGSATFKNMVKKFGNLCAPDNLILDAKQAACKGGAVSGGGVKYTLVSATLTTVGGSVTAQDIVINEQLGFMFVDLYYV
jgi:hypothetical protein